MATAPEQEPNEELEPTGIETEVETDDYDPANDPVAPLAMRMGWVPKDQFKGDVSKWKPADQYILDGHDIQTRTSKELREIKSTVDTMSRTTAQIIEDKLAEKQQLLASQYQEAFDDGDAERAFRLSQQMTQLQNAPRPSVGGDPVTKFKAENEWYGKDPLASDLAYQTCDRLSKQGFSVEQQLEAARLAVAREFPDLVPDAAPAARRPTAPSVRAPTTRTTAPSNRQKGFHDMPKAAQDTAKRLVESGHLKDVDGYTAKYWQNAGGKA